MPEVSRDELIRQIHTAPGQAVLAITGGGSRAISELLSMPGASRTILSATVPYAARAMEEFLGAKPERYCTEHTARVMAAAAWEKAGRYAAPQDDAGAGQPAEIFNPSPSGRGKARQRPGEGETENEGGSREGEQNTGAALPPALSQSEMEMNRKRLLIGLGCTASLVSDRPKRGEHRLHVAWHTATATEVASLVLEKDARSRGEEEDVAAVVVVNMLAAASGLEERVAIPLREGERIETVHQTAEPEWTALVLGEAPLAKANADAEPSRLAIFPGAFHPLHEGHRGILKVGEKLLGRPASLEISIQNVDKPPLDFVEIRLRLEGLDGRPVWLTRAATFVEKARLFPGATFLVGADTIERIAEPKYYGGDEGRMLAAIGAIADLGCKFLVFGREDDGPFETLHDLSLPPSLVEICQEVPAAMFREDISSTEIRQSWPEE